MVAWGKVIIIGPGIRAGWLSGPVLSGLERKRKEYEKNLVASGIAFDLLWPSGVCRGVE